MSKRDFLILECRYYNGEPDNPFSQKLSAFEAELWYYERFWVGEYDKEDTKLVHEANKNYEKELLDFEPNDGTPIELKALLWSRYEQWTSGSLDGFKKWYLKYYQSRPTNRQRRAEERRKTLIPMCRYYKGEEQCPSQKKELFRSYEKKWVEDLSYSYTRGDAWRKTCEEKQLRAFAYKYNIPTTLIGLLYGRFMHWGSGYETTEDFYNWLEEQYLT